MSVRYPSKAAIGQALIAATGPRTAQEPTPAEVVGWLARLRLLEGVPFTYLVSDERLLPAESIRFFFLDRNWTDAAVDGALSAGATTSRDRAHLIARHAVVRQDVDAAERDVRIGVTEPGTTYPAAPAETITGFLLRSRLVSGWPGLHVRAVHDGEPVRRLRIERLAPGILLAMFDGLPTSVLVEEPRQGLQFGVDVDPGGGFLVDRRPPGTGSVAIPFRPGDAGVIDIRRLHDDLGGQGAAALAARIVQYPYRQEFTGPGDTPLFSPSLSLDDLAELWEES